MIIILTAFFFFNFPPIRSAMEQCFRTYIHLAKFFFSMYSPSSSPKWAALSVLEGSVWGWCVRGCPACWQLPHYTKGQNFSTLRVLLQWVSPTHLHGWCSFNEATGFQLHSCLSRKAVPFSQLPPQDANCEDHYSRQQEEWISQINILLDYPANPLLWVRTAHGLKSLKTKQHKSFNILKQGNGQP